MRDGTPTFLCVVTLAAAALFIAPSWVADGPIPDAVEYLVTAQRLAHFESFRLLLLGQEVPSQYPFGFPAFLAPAYWLPGATLASGIYGVLLAGVGAVALTYGLARRIGGTLAGVAAAVTLLLRPNFIDYNHQVMTESLTVALAVAAGFLLHLAAGAGGHRLGRYLLAVGVVCGFAILVRYTNILLMVAVVLSWVAYRQARGERGTAGLVWPVLLLLAGPALAVGALAAYQQATFGSVLTTGYDYWLPARYGSLGATFSLRYALIGPRYPAEGLLSGWPNAAYHAVYLVMRVSWPLFLLPALGGALALFRRRDHPNFAVACYVASCVLLLYVTYSMYASQKGRFLAPLFPLVAVLTGVGLKEGFAAARRGKTLGWVLVASWCAGAVATLPGLAERSYLIQRYVRGQHEPTPFPLRGRSLEAYAAVRPPGAAIVTALPLPLLDSGLVSHRRIIPLGRGRYWEHPKLKGVATLAEQRQTVDSALSRGELVYTDAYSLAVVRYTPEYAAERRAVEAFGLAPVAESARSGRVLLFRLALLGAAGGAVVGESPVPAGQGGMDVGASGDELIPRPARVSVRPARAPS
jgi:4-amino-4-deoxy-L-arabinose transferase-like glycosyltransferase